MSVITEGKSEYFKKLYQSLIEEGKENDQASLRGLEYMEQLRNIAYLSENEIVLNAGESIIHEGKLLEIAIEGQRLWESGNKWGFWNLMLGPEKPKDGKRRGEKLKALSKEERVLLDHVYIDSAHNNIFGILSNLQDEKWELEDAGKWPPVNIN
jgi:hypothetical protein